MTTPSAEAVASTYLRTDGDVTDIADERVGTRHPADRSTPWARVTLLDEVGGSQPRHLVGARLQIDCYGGANTATAQAEADALSRAIIDALDIAHEAEHDGAVVTGTTVHSRHRLPDTDFEPARERYIADVTVWLHPTQTGS